MNNKQVKTGTQTSRANVCAAVGELRMACSCKPATPLARALEGTWIVIALGTPPACCAGTVICTGTKLVTTAGFPPEG